MSCGAPARIGPGLGRKQEFLGTESGYLSSGQPRHPWTPFAGDAIAQSPSLNHVGGHPAMGDCVKGLGNLRCVTQSLNYITVLHSRI